jgi:nitroimidazol reductase NimA-like FMN-containing flavoprotein (pyridoxamine 5'-phosphate oxidase superfamily)
MSIRKPEYLDLGERASRALLRRHHAGRLAFTFRDRVDIEPIGYVLDGDWLYGRTSPGTKLVQVAHNPWVAFEVDEIEGPFDWRSVVVRGTVYFLNDPGQEHPDYARAVKLLRRLDPGVLHADDLAPHRTVFFRIHLNEVTGRRARLSAIAGSRAAKSPTATKRRRGDRSR